MGHDRTSARDKADRLRRWIIVGLAGLLLACVISLLAIGHADANTVEYEIFKGLVQVIALLVIGTALTLASSAYQLYQQAAEREHDRDCASVENVRDVQRATLKEATDSYNAVKRARRLMRARAVSKTGPEPVVVAPLYDDYMMAINDCQLEFEKLARYIETRPEVFSQGDDLQDLFRRLEKFLRELGKEYEGARPMFAGEPPQYPLARLERLGAFLGHGGFREFQEPFREAQQSLRDDLRRSFEDVPDRAGGAQDVAAVPSMSPRPRAPSATG